jgi:hypothetical protein
MMSSVSPPPEKKATPATLVDPSMDADQTTQSRKRKRPVRFGEISEGVEDISTADQDRYAKEDPNYEDATPASETETRGSTKRTKTSKSSLPKRIKFQTPTNVGDFLHRRERIDRPMEEFYELLEKHDAYIYNLTNAKKEAAAKRRGAEDDHKKAVERGRIKDGAKAVLIATADSLKDQLDRQAKENAELNQTIERQELTIQELQESLLQRLDRRSTTLRPRTIPRLPRDSQSY